MNKIGIIGASGYVGGELVRILLQHPQSQIDQITSRQFAGKSVWKAHPALRNSSLRFTEYNADRMSECDVVFSCLPHTSSAPIVKELFETQVRIIDTSADFRLRDVAVYERVYGVKHAAPELVEKSVYGIPELHREEIQKTRLVAGAGCEATANILALAPLRGKVSETIADVKIGGSAAGREPSLGTHYPERANSVRPYAPAGHRHEEEILQETGVSARITAHAVDLVRGILATNHIIRYAPGAKQRPETNNIAEYNPDTEQGLELEQTIQQYRDFYKNSHFVRITPTQIQFLPNPKYVFGSNYCDIGFAQDPHNKRIVVFSAIDNLVKGAAGQAVQCMNLMLGLDETTGLLQAPLYPI